MSVLITDGRVEVASLPGKSVLELNRYTVRRPVEEAQDPLILSLDCRKGFDFKAWRDQIPKSLWRRAEQGQMLILFDASTEGVLHQSEHTDKAHAFLTKRRIPLSQAVYLTQDRSYEADYAASTGLPPGQRMRVLHADYWIRRFFMGLEKSGPAIFEARYARYLARGEHRDRRFISLNHTPREAKVLFLLRLLRDSSWDDGFISFGGFGQNHRGKLVHSRVWPDEFAELGEQHDRLTSMGRFLLDERGDSMSADYTMPVYDADLPQHDRSWFTIVPETEMRNRPSRITEKPCKPLVNFHPVIFLGNPGSLDLLRELGFQTFEGFFDERYDQEPDPKIRFDLVYDQVLSLVRADEKELARKMAIVSERVVHNARWGLTDLPRVFRKRHDYALLRGILGL